MDSSELLRNQVLSPEKDSKINVVISNPDGYEDDTIDFGRVFHNMKLRKRLFAWILILCMFFGICAPLLLYQFTRDPLTVSSIITLNYTNKGLVAPDRTDLDLNLITSSYVLQQALSKMSLSQPVSITNLRTNIRITKILTDDVRRQQEVISQMIADKSTSAYATAQELNLTWQNRFMVSLANGFGDEESKIKVEVTDAELQLLLNRILAAYNDYLVLTYADQKLPDDEISVIDTENLDILESLDLLRAAMNKLFDYCDDQSDEVKTYRSSVTGLSLTDLMETLRLAENVNVEYLYSYVYTNSLVRDRETMITSYRYQLRNAQTKLDVINEHIATTQTILDTYKNDEIFVSMQESDASKSTSTTTDYYNELVLQQAENYSDAAKLEVTIANLQDKIDSLNTETAAQALDTVQEELQQSITVCKQVYDMICDQMTEIFNSHSFTDYIQYTAAQGKTQGYLAASAKKMIIGAVAGVFIACALWFLAGLAPEFRRRRERDEQKEGIRA